MSAPATLPLPTLARIGKLFAMLSSENDGEALNAVRAVTRVLLPHNSTWADLAPSLAGGARRPDAMHWRPHPVPPSAPWQRQVMRCRDAPHLFSQWERDFLTGIAGRPSVSAKQAATLDALHAKAMNHFTSGGTA